MFYLAEEQAFHFSAVVLVSGVTYQAKKGFFPLKTNFVREVDRASFHNFRFELQCRLREIRNRHYYLHVKRNTLAKVFFLKMGLTKFFFSNFHKNGSAI